MNSRTVRFSLQHANCFKLAQVFVNNYLVVDLGSVHAAETGSVTFDEDTAASYGMSLGLVYNLDVFYAERRSTGASCTPTAARFLRVVLSGESPTGYVTV